MIQMFCMCNLPWSKIPIGEVGGLNFSWRSDINGNQANSVHLSACVIRALNP